MLAIIGGNPSRFRSYVDVFHSTLAKLGRERLPVGAHSPGHVANTDAQAREDVWPHYREMMIRIGRERTPSAQPWTRRGGRRASA